jgi:hypothetical protein
VEITKNQIKEMRVTYKEKFLDFFDSIFGPIIYALAILLKVKTDYVKGEKLILVESLGKEDTPMYIPARSIVTFVQNPSVDGDLDPLIAINYEDRVLAVKEISVIRKSWLKRKKISYQFNFKMMKGNKRLRKYHPFLIPKIIYVIYYFIKDLFRRKDV